MLRLGAHESIAGGLSLALERGKSVGCESLQIWTRNGRQWSAPPLNDDAVERFLAARRASDIRPIAAHASYLINIASSDPELHRRSVDALKDEARRCQLLDVPYLILHPGAHTGAGEEAGLARAVSALREVLASLESGGFRVLLETTAGQGTAMGGDFEGIARILGELGEGDRLGVCLDTCHIFAAGYELRTESGYETTMSEFDRAIGLDRLYVVHINDSRHPLGSRKDRHAHIGEGEIGLPGFTHILTDPRLDGLPGILETPKSADLHEDRDNLARLRTLVEDSSPPAPDPDAVIRGSIP